MKLKIIVAEDHAFFRKGVVLALNRLKYAEIIGEASNGQELLDMVKENTPHIILTDIKMPVMDGIEATKEILKINPEIKVVVLSMFGDEDNFHCMIEAGVQGFLLKNIDSDDLDRALQAVAQDQQYFSPEFIPYFRNKYIGESKNNTENSNALTKRELEILQFVAKGYSNQEIADKLLISIRTVTSHRANLNMKTGSKNTVKLLIYAIRNNLIEL